MRESVSQVLTWILAGALVVSILATGYIAVNPPDTTDPFTEFYILGEEDEAADYPTTLAPGESGTVIVGISNHEDKDVTYRVAVTWNESQTLEQQISVPDTETRERELTLTAPDESGRYRVRFLLYRTDTQSTEPYRTLRLWITVQ